MDLQPWDYYDEQLQPKGNTARIVSLLESVMARNPDHPGALHLYVHAVEASADPQRGVAAADHLRELIPGSGHLVHMPAHIYARVGRWHDAVVANQKAIAADNDYLDTCRGNAQGRVSARLCAAQPPLPVVCGQHGGGRRDRTATPRCRRRHASTCRT